MDWPGLATCTVINRLKSARVGEPQDQSFVEEQHPTHQGHPLGHQTPVPSSAVQNSDRSVAQMERPTAINVDWRLMHATVGRV